MTGISWIVDDGVARENSLHEILGPRLNRLSGDVGVVLTNNPEACRRWPTGILLRDDINGDGKFPSFGGEGQTAVFHSWRDDLDDTFRSVNWGEKCLIRHKHGAASGYPEQILQIVKMMKENDCFLLSDEDARTLRMFSVNHRILAAAEAHGSGSFRPIPVHKGMMGTYGVSFIDCHYTKSGSLAGVVESDIATSWEGFDPALIIRNVERYVGDETAAEKHMAEIRCMASIKGLDLSVSYKSAMILKNGEVFKAPFPYELTWRQKGFSPTNCRRFGDPKKMARFVRSL